jgi:hypothetical protein
MITDYRNAMEDEQESEYEEFESEEEEREEVTEEVLALRTPLKGRTIQMYIDESPKIPRAALEQGWNNWLAEHRWQLCLSALDTYPSRRN